MFVSKAAVVGGGTMGGEIAQAIAAADIQVVVKDIDQKFVDADFDVDPGDTLETHCVYDSTERAGVTPGGVASDEEMCLNFMMYYPKVSGEKCGSF